MLKGTLKNWLKGHLEGLFSRDFISIRNRLAALKEEQERLREEGERDRLALLRRLQVLELANRGIKVGGVVNPGGGSWVTIGYKVGDKAFVNFYDFEDRNIGALRDFLEKMERAGMAVLVKSPFTRQPARKERG